MTVKNGGYTSWKERKHGNAKIEIKKYINDFEVRQKKISKQDYLRKVRRKTQTHTQKKRWLPEMILKYRTRITQKKDKQINLRRKKYNKKKERKKDGIIEV